MAKRGHISLTERLAAALSCILPQDVRDDLRARRVPAAEVIALFDMHHIRFHSIDCDDRWHNLHPMLRADHKARTPKDISAIAKVKRLARVTEEASRRLLAKEPGKSARPKSRWPKRKMQSRNQWSRK
jgi:hypothetical protein